MGSFVQTALEGNECLLSALTISVATSVVLLAIMGYHFWSQRAIWKRQKRIFRTRINLSHEPEDLFLTDKDSFAYGELIAQFRVNHGKQVVSVLESEGKRFIHVAGDLSSHERVRMMHYLKSEGFMS
jgi:hypothetical protein